MHHILIAVYIFAYRKRSNNQSFGFHPPEMYLYKLKSYLSRKLLIQIEILPIQKVTYTN